jgi:hypothetical protein
MRKTEERQAPRFSRGVFFILPVLALGCTFAGTRAFGAGQDSQQQSKDKAPPPAKSAAASLTGCVDEQEGNYVLLSDQTMNPIANLVADGFAKEDFAKHVGHKVTVRGTSSSQGALPLFKVRTIERVSDTCAPQR